MLVIGKVFFSSVPEALSQATNVFLLKAYFYTDYRLGHQ